MIVECIGGEVTGYEYYFQYEDIVIIKIILAFLFYFKYLK